MDSSIYKRKSIRYLVLLGVFLLNLPGGFSVYYGNLHAYMVSYYRYCLPSDRVDVSPAWVLAVCLAFLPVGSLVAGTMAFKLGLKVSVFTAVLLYALGFFLSYISVQHSVWATTLTFGVLGMFGLGIIEVLSYSFTSMWFPENQGFAGSVVGASSAVGAILYNSIITTYINPNNKGPDLISGDIAYFTQSHILDRIPMTFVLLGIVSFVAQMIGFLMVVIPCFTDSEKEPILKKDSVIKKCEMGGLSSTSSSASSLSSISEDSGDVSSTGVDKVKGNPIAKDDKRENIVYIEAYDNEFDLSPKYVLKSVTFYLMWFSIMALSLALLVVSNYYKLFAQMWITDDAFLTLTGNSSAFTNMLMRIFTGYISDKFKMKNVFIATLSTTSIFMTFWYFSARLHRWIYFFSTTILSGLTGSVFVLYPLASMKFFGLTYFATNTGLIMLAMTLVEVASAPIIIFLISMFGWFGLFFTVSVFIAASFIATALFMQRSQVL